MASKVYMCGVCTGSGWRVFNPAAPPPPYLLVISDGPAEATGATDSVRRRHKCLVCLGSGLTMDPAQAQSASGCSGGTGKALRLAPGWNSDAEEDEDGSNPCSSLCRVLLRALVWLGAISGHH